MFKIDYSISDDIEDDGNMDPKFSVFIFFATFVLKHNAPFGPKKYNFFVNVGKSEETFVILEPLKGFLLNSRFRKHYLGVTEPPQIQNGRYFSRVFQLFLGAKRNSCFCSTKKI